MFAAARRRKPGEMNKTEAAYCAHLEAELAAGRVAWFAFEGIKLRLADRSFLTMDFAVLPVDGGILELHDTKGSEHMISEDAKVKMAVAAEHYPFIFKVAIPRKKRDGGGWAIRQV
jgi:hypothetical protein